MTLTDGEVLSLSEEYTPQELMAVVTQARDYLREVVTTGKEYKGRPIELEMSTWGYITEYRRYKVCFSGLWYLMETGKVVGDIPYSCDNPWECEPPVPNIMLFLNGLRFPSHARDAVLELMGVDTSDYDYVVPIDDNPHLLLEFLDWLVVQPQALRW